MKKHKLPQLCFYCDNLLGCPYLGDSRGIFIPERVITPEQPRECLDWVPISIRQKSLRETLYGIQGDGCIRILYSVSKVIMQDLDKQVEEGEVGMDDRPDFENWTDPSMPVEEREEQLRYEYDDEGNIIIEDGRKRPRPSYVLRKFACDPNGTIGLDHSVGMGWNNDLVIKFILDSEVEQGLIMNPKKSKSRATKPNKGAVKKPAPKETKTMAGEGRRVLIKRDSKTAGKKGKEKEESKVATPPRRGAKGAGTKPKSSSSAAEVPEGDFSGVLEEIKAAALESNQLLIDKINELTTAVEALHQRVEEHEQASNDRVTVLHDVMVEAEVLAGADPKIDEEGGILSYLAPGE